MGESTDEGSRQFMKHIYLTKEGMEKLKGELSSLKERRPQMVKHLEEARSLGDLRENAEYHATKEALLKLTKRIADIEDKVKIARVIEKVSNDTALIGAVVHVKNLNSGDEFKYQLVDPEEVDIDSGKISINSPIGSGLFEHKAGETVEIEVPSGTLKLTIIKIE